MLPYYKRNDRSCYRDDDTVDRSKGAGAAKGAAKMLATGAAPCSSCHRAPGQGRISAVAISR